MTVAEFMDNFKISNPDLVNRWIKERLIPGIKQDPQTGDTIIPDLAWPPFTEARARNAASIQASIVKACLIRKRPFARFYKISETEFNIYMDGLINAGLISRRVVDNVDYYFATPSSREYFSSNNNILSLVKIAVKMASVIPKG